MSFPWIEMGPGVRRRTLSVGKNVMQAMVEFAPNSPPQPVAEHSHVHEQLIFVAAGEIILTIQGKPQTLKQGNGIAIPSGVSHGAWSTGNGATLIDTFTPLREDFLEKDRAAMAKA